MRILRISIKLIKMLYVRILLPVDWILSYLTFSFNGINITSFKSYGIPIINVALKGDCRIGRNFRLNNRIMSNPIGRFSRCCLIVGNGGSLIIGNNVGISSSTIVCHRKIVIGDNVKIGGNVVVYDTDFHSLNSDHRSIKFLDLENTQMAEVIIENNVFIGAHSTILKGLTIGQNAVIGACSVVTKNIPSNEIWAGNPAKFIKMVG